MSNPNLSHARILIVEDSMADVVLIKHFFHAEKISNQVSYASSLHQARHLLREHTFQLCFIDVQLPDGSGFELIDALNTNQTTSIMLSDSEDIEHILYAKGLGVDAYIRKPLTRATLDRLVKELRQLSWEILVD